MSTEESTALVPTNGVVLSFGDFAGTTRDEYKILVPENEKWQDIIIRAAFLKKGPMASESFATCVCVVRYADAMGLNEVLGDLYIVNGKIATTADAKIRHAMGSGLIAGYQVEIKKGAIIGLEYTFKGSKVIFKSEDMHAKITVKVKGWELPVIYEADLKDWFNGSNAAWREHTEYMFRKNCLSKALAEVAPLGVDADELPAPIMPEKFDKAVEAMRKPHVDADAVVA